MTAALEVGRWDERIVHPLDADGAQGRQELARACGDLFAAALGRYYCDAQSVLRGAIHGNDGGESLEDLTGSRRLLEALCDPIGADAEVVAAAMIEALDAGLRFKPAGMNRPVVERPEDYRLGEWREKSKRRGKPVPITLG